MKICNKLSLFSLLSLSILSGCAAGAATSAYSLKAQSADSLTSSAEQRIIDRAKREIREEMSSSQRVYN